MKTYKYELGLFHGRFQHIHLGHQKIIDKMLKECKIGVLLVGNTQAQRTAKNPFNILERLALIKTIYKNPRLIIGFFPDLPNVPETEKEYSEWGEWIIGFCELWSGFIPDVIYGGDETKLEWLYKNYPKIDLVKVSREELPVSATEVKDLLIQNRKEEWERITDQKIHSQYDKLREVVEEIQKRKEVPRW